MSKKFLHELPALDEAMDEDLILVSRAEVESSMRRNVFLALTGSGLDMSWQDPAIEVAAGATEVVKGERLVELYNNFEDAFDQDQGIFTAPLNGIYMMEMQVEATSLAADGAGPLTLRVFTSGVAGAVAKQIVPVNYSITGGFWNWNGRIVATAFLDKNEQMYFAVQRVGAPAASVSTGRIRIHKLA